MFVNIRWGDSQERQCYYFDVAPFTSATTRQDDESRGDDRSFANEINIKPFQLLNVKISPHLVIYKNIQSQRT